MKEEIPAFRKYLVLGLGGYSIGDEVYISTPVVKYCFK
jgi:hypothetical protein